MEQLTRAAAKRLEDEMHLLEHVERPRLQDDVVRAQGAGDIAENPDVRMVLSDLARVDARIKEISRLLASAAVVDVVSTEAVAPGLVVLLSIDGDEERFLFGSVDDRHPDFSVLTASSPIGQAVAGHKVGDEIMVDLGGHKLSVVILSIEA